MNSDQANYERPRIVNIELGPRGSRPTEHSESLPQTSSTAGTPRRVPKFPQFLLKCGKSSTVRWILILIALICTFGIGFGAGGYVVWKQGFCEQNLPAVMNNTLTVGHRPVVSGGRKLSMNVGLAWIWSWLLVTCFFGARCGF
ncbi:hypothetical protein DL98DRAFT_579600 [Cadophora sp. DSE1049]|nr:hypothetical protein DL98DRAFT_579600 [Cadophora sp. DSE1049]